MIDIEWDAGNYRARFTGHAGYAEHGRDIVCAAVSALYSVLTDNMRTREEESDEGVTVTADPHSAAEEVIASVLFQAVGNTLKRIAEQYPDNVRITKV